MTGRFETIAVIRDCMATTVPDGEWVLLRAGREVQVTQQLGGSITVRTERGPLLRIGAAAGHAGVDLVAGDALRLPFADASFDAVTVSFGLRNTADVDAAPPRECPITRSHGPPPSGAVAARSAA